MALEDGRIIARPSLGGQRGSAAMDGVSHAQGARVAATAHAAVVDDAAPPRVN
jgi:hypothetical protein